MVTTSYSLIPSCTLESLCCLLAKRLVRSQGLTHLQMQGHQVAAVPHLRAGCDVRHKRFNCTTAKGTVASRVHARLRPTTPLRQQQLPNTVKLRGFRGRPTILAAQVQCHLTITCDALPQYQFTSLCFVSRRSLFCDLQWHLQPVAGNSATLFAVLCDPNDPIHV